ncbi:MAG: hypothetical protein WD468_07550 [Pirellulales bacterium]
MRDLRISLAARLANGTVGAVFLCAVFAGCQKGNYDRVPVSGQVLIDGSPLTVGFVRFVPIGGGRPSVAVIGVDGRYDFGEKGVVVGKHRIEVSASEQVGATGYRWHAPEKYANYSSSGLEQEITKPTSDLVLKLTWAGGKPFTVQSAGGDEDPKNLRARQK